MKRQAKKPKPLLLWAMLDSHGNIFGISEAEPRLHVGRNGVARVRVSVVKVTKKAERVTQTPDVPVEIRRRAKRPKLVAGRG